MKLATLLYIRNKKGDYLLMKRENEPNKGFFSPAGGKLRTDIAESPNECAVREAHEECGIESVPDDWKLMGIVTERDYPGIGNIMIFLFDYRKRLTEKPVDSIEGRFVFVSPEEIENSKIPETDKLYLWDFVLKAKRDFFSIKIDCTKNPYNCIIEQN
ncbi:MAG TPA: NUDIX hydrolase [Ignavibacteria bacterium]